MAKSFPAAKLKKLPSNFVETVESMKESEINSKIIEIEKGIMALQEDKEKDMNLERLRSELKENSDTYAIPVKEHRAMIDYLLFVLAGRGKV